MGSAIHYDIMLPPQLKQVSPNYYGATQLYVNIPSLGLNTAYLGQVELTPLPVGQWNTVTFTPPSSVLSKLRGSYTDLRVTIVVNAPYNATQPYLLDNLRFSDSTLALVTVADGGAHPISGLTVVAYNGATPTSDTGVTDSTGVAKVWVPAGSYRFGVTEAGVTTYSSPTNQCRVPGTCPAATIIAKCHGVVCAAKDGCHDAGICNPDTGACFNPAKPAGTVCRASAGPCDTPEMCDGTAADCPQDGFLQASLACRPAAGPCDVAEVCSGADAACPDDAFLPASTVCRPAVGDCDVAENCSGAGAACPLDAKKADNTPCDGANACTLNACQSGTCISGTTSIGPAAPVGLSASSSPGAVALRWTASPGATTYSVKRSTSSGGPYATIAPAVGSTSYNDTDLASGGSGYGATVYYYVVAATNACGVSDASNEVSGDSAPRMPPRRLPAPPKAVGCYVGTPDGWASVPCTPPDQVSIGHLQVQPGIRSVPVEGMTKPVEFQFAQVDATFVTLGGVEQNGAYRNTLSLQANTNDFDGSGNHNYAVQFVLATVGQSDKNPWGYAVGNTICIAPVDRTVACQGVEAGSPCTNGAGYLPNICVGSGSSPAYIGSLPRDFQPFDFATLAASTFTDGGQSKIGLVGQFSWFDPAHDFTEDGNGNGTYAVVTNDDIGLGLQGNWWSISGTFFGLGMAEQAVFANPSSVLTRTLAGSCATPGSGPFADIPWPGACPSQLPFLPYAANILDHITVETNNLTIVGAPTTLASYEPTSVYTEFLASTDGACQPGGAPVYLRDSTEDTGVVPSNSGGQPFWESPDILVVLHNEPVNANTPASNSLIAFGQTYDFYVRVHNDFGCSPVYGAKTRLFLADPSALMQDWSVGEISGDQYAIGPTQQADKSGGVTVEARQAALIGPFTWKAPNADAGIGSLHKCLLAAITAENEGPPTTDGGVLPPAYSSYQVAQRNVQFEDCSWPLISTQSGSVSITLTVNGAAPQLGADGGVDNNDIQVTFDDPNGNWGSVWKSASAASRNPEYIATYDGIGKTAVRLAKTPVALPAVPLTAGTSPVATVTITGAEQTTSVAFRAALTLGDAGAPFVINGNTCTYKYKTVP